MAGISLWGGNSIPLSLSIIAGYLAFCHWCYESHRIRQDAMALTVAVVLLVVYYHHDEWPQIIRSGTSLWLITHWLRLVVSSSSTTKVEAKTAVPTLGVWKIHGQDYDLSNYVNHHPGGREAIMLGMNRDDCTALFESYHPFTKETAQAVLNKYERKGSKPMTRQTTDPLYQELCDTVAETLKAHGLDPIRDRTASLQRQYHYGVVVLGTIISGFYHFKVCGPLS